MTEAPFKCQPRAMRDKHGQRCKNAGLVIEVDHRGTALMHRGFLSGLRQSLEMMMTRKKSGDATLQAQFPRDPNRAAEAGFTTGEAAPEKPGRRMQTPEKISHKLPPDLRAESRVEAEQQRAKTSKEAKLAAAFDSEAEKIGPQGNFDRGSIDQDNIDR